VVKLAYVRNVRKIFDSNEKEINRLAPIVAQINSWEEKTKKLKDEAFPKKTKEFKERVEEGEPLDNILPEAFALVREAARRTIGQRHFDAQLMASIVLSEGKSPNKKPEKAKLCPLLPRSIYTL